jgi:hypothetical protein
MKFIFLSLISIITTNLYGQLYLGTLNDSTTTITSLDDGKYEVKVRGWSNDVNGYIDVRKYISSSIPVGFHQWDEKDANGNYYTTKHPLISGNDLNYKNDIEKYKNNLGKQGYSINSETSSTSGIVIITWKNENEYISVTFINGKFDSQITTKF